MCDLMEIFGYKISQQLDFMHSHIHTRMLTSSKTYISKWWDQDDTYVRQRTRSSGCRYISGIPLDWEQKTCTQFLSPWQVRALQNLLRCKFQYMWRSPETFLADPPVPQATQPGSDLKGHQMDQHGSRDPVSRSWGLHSYGDFSIGRISGQTPNHFSSLLSPCAGHTMLLPVLDSPRTHQTLKDLGQMFPRSC